MIGISTLARVVERHSANILAMAPSEGMVDRFTFFVHILPAYGIDHRPT